MTNRFIDFLRSFFSTRNILLIVSASLFFVFVISNNLGLFPLSLGDFLFFSCMILLFALYRPGWAFLLFIGLLPIEIINIAPVELGISLRPYQLVGALTLLAIIIRRISGRLSFQLPRLCWVDYAVFVIWIGSLISIVNAPETSVSLKQSIILFSYLALYYLTRVFVRNADDIRKVAPFFIASGLWVSLYAIWQNIRFGLGSNAFEVMSGRPNSVFTEPDWLGVFLMLCISAIYAGLIFLKQSVAIDKAINEQLEISIPARRKITIGLLYAVLFVFDIALVLSVSRSAWLGTFVLTGVFLTWLLTKFSFEIREWQWKESILQGLYIVIVFGLSLMSVLVFHLTTFQLFNRVQSTASGLQLITVACKTQTNLPESIENIEELDAFGCRHIMLEEKEIAQQNGEAIQEVYRNDPNVDIRKEIYTKVNGLIKQYPVAGIGWGSAGYFLGKDERGAGLNASNMFLEIWLGSGLIGIIAFVVLWIGMMVALFQRMHMYIHRGNAFFACIFFVISWVGMTIFNLFNSGLLLGFFWIWLAVFASFVRVKINN